MCVIFIQTFHIHEQIYTFSSKDEDINVNEWIKHLQFRAGKKKPHLTFCLLGFHGEGGGSGEETAKKGGILKARFLPEIFTSLIFEKGVLQPQMNNG